MFFCFPNLDVLENEKVGEEGVVNSDILKILLSCRRCTDLGEVTMEANVLGVDNASDPKESRVLGDAYVGLEDKVSVCISCSLLTGERDLFGLLLFSFYSVLNRKRGVASTSAVSYLYFRSLKPAGSDYLPTGGISQTSKASPLHMSSIMALIHNLNPFRNS